MKAERIVCPVDYSEASRAALRLAVTLARESGGLLFVLHVDEAPIPSPGAHAVDYLPEPPAELGASSLEAIVPDLAKARVEYHTCRGIASDEITSFANRHDADMIVMGTHGRHGLARMLMGSTAEAVVRWAKCPVLTVKTPLDASGKS